MEGGGQKKADSMSALDVDFYCKVAIYFRRRIISIIFRISVLTIYYKSSTLKYDFEELSACF